MELDFAGGRVTVRVEAGVGEVRLAHPGRMNALDQAMFAGLVAAGERLAESPGLRAVVLSGAGRAFCSGLDLEAFAAEGGLEVLASRLRPRTHGPANLFQRAATIWRDMPVPVVAALHGVVYGGGLQVAFGADIRLAAPDCRLSIMEIRWGIVPDMGGTALMAGLVRPDVLRELTFTGRVVSGEEAVACGLVTRLEPEPREAALALARSIAERSPDAVRAAKRLLDAGAADGLAATLLRESDEQARLIGAPNQREAVAANLAGRPARFADPAPASSGDFS